MKLAANESVGEKIFKHERRYCNDVFGPVMPYIIHSVIKSYFCLCETLR